MQTLPRDGTAWYLTVFGEAGDAKFVKLQSWLTTDKGLVKLKSQVRFNKYTTDQVRYQRYVKNVPGLPCIRLQDEMGQVVSEFWGDNIPSAATTLYQGIKDDLQDKTRGCLRRRRCPKPEPKPEPPSPVIVNVPEPPVGPPVLDDPELELKESKLWLLLVVLGALGGGAYGFVEGYKAERINKAGPSSAKL